MTTSGLADSPLFSATGPKGSLTSPSSGIVKVRNKEEKHIRSAVKPSKQPRHRDTLPPRNHETTVSRYHDTMVESVRKSVKEFGKEAATHRFTLEEKKAIADIVYTYKRRNIKTSENEITRIGVNFLVQDHIENGKLSILDLVIKALNE